MGKRAVDSDFPIGKVTRIKNFLPPPEKLVFPRDTVKVTLFLSKTSVQFFKGQAARHRTKYQRMIRELVDLYAERFEEGK